MRRLKNKKLISILMLLFITGAGSKIFAQWAVLDMANLMQAIETAYQYYQQVQNTIQQVQNSYEQIKQAYDQVASMNFDDLKNLGENFNGMSDNPFEVITGVRNSAQDITKAVNKNMNKLNDLQDALHAETITFGDMKFSIADLCGAGDPEKNMLGFVKNAWDVTVDSGKDSIAGYLGNLTYEQKQAIMRKYGMSPRNYATLEVANYGLSESVKNMSSLGTIQGLKQTVEEIESDQAAIDIMMKNAPEGSLYAQQQIANNSVKILVKDIGNIGVNLQRLGGLCSEYIKSNKTKEALEQEEEQKKKEIADNSTAISSEKNNPLISDR